MKKIALSIAVAAAMGVVSQSANAALASNATLSIDAGSNFGMEVSPGFWLDTQITGFNGINLGTTQLATGSHSGPANGTESPNIDNPWGFFGNTGMHQTTSNTTVLSAAGNSATVDFSGWSVTWNSIADIPMSGGASNGVATVTCAVDCGNGDTYTLSYLATVPVGDPSSFGGVNYRLNLVGTVSAIPVPAAVWLFGSGLLGLVGVARRKAKA